MRCRVLLLILVSLSLGCSSSGKRDHEIESSPYALDISIVTGIDTTLITKFHKYVVIEDAGTLRSLNGAKMFPQIFPDVLFLNATFEGGSGPGMHLCYDTLEGRFYPIMRDDYVGGVNELIGDRFSQGITEEQAFWIAAAAVYVLHNPAYVVSRPADLFLGPRMRDYYLEHYPLKPNASIPERTNHWWAWNAFPAANDDYRGFFSAYEDSIAESEMINDIPEGTFGIPSVSTDGIYFVVTFYAKDRGSGGEVSRFRIRLTENGQIHSKQKDAAYYL